MPPQNTSIFHFEYTEIIEFEDIILLYLDKLKITFRRNGTRNKLQIENLGELQRL